jgi:LPXTG-motif cell wall-anchored protein
MKKFIALITSVILTLVCGVSSLVVANVSAEEYNYDIMPKRDNMPKIEFCEMNFILDYEQYFGVFLDSNRDVYSFMIEDVTEDWNLYGSFSGEPIKLTDPMPQEGLLNYLYEHFDECTLIGKTSVEDYENYKNELNQIDLNAEMEYRLFAEPDVVGLSHTEKFAVRYDDNGNRQIVFLCGGIDAKYDLYLENPDEHAIALNGKMIQYEEINEPTTTDTTTTQIITTTPSTTETTTTSYTTQSTTESATTTTLETTVVSTNVNATSESITTATTDTITANNIAFVYNDFSWGVDAYCYSGIYVTKDGEVYKFEIDNKESWTYRTSDFDYIPIDLYGYADLSDAVPQASMLQELNSTTYEKVGNVSEENVSYYLTLLDSVDENQNVICRYRNEDNILPYSETWGIRESDAKVIFLNGGDDIYLTHIDENANIIDKWIRNLAENYMTSESVKTSATCTSTTTTTTTTIKYFASEDEFCEMAAEDFAQKTGKIPTKTEATVNDNGTLAIQLLDEDANILDTYTIDQVTGKGTDSSGEEVNLPQTGYSDIYKFVVVFAVLMIVSGAVIIVKTKKENE